MSATADEEKAASTPIVVPGASPVEPHYLILKACTHNSYKEGMIVPRSGFIPRSLMAGETEDAARVRCEGLIDEVIARLTRLGAIRLASVADVG